MSESHGNSPTQIKHPRHTETDKTAKIELVWATINAEVYVCLQSVSAVAAIVTAYLHERVLVEVWNDERAAFDIMDFDLAFNHLTLVHQLVPNEQAIFSNDRPGNRLVGAIHYGNGVLRKYTPPHLRSEDDKVWQIVNWPTAEEEEEEEEKHHFERSSPMLVVPLEGKLLFFMHYTYELHLKDFTWHVRLENPDDPDDAMCTWGEANSNGLDGGGTRIASDGLSTVYVHDAAGEYEPLTRWYEGEHKAESAVVPPLRFLPYGIIDLEDWKDVTLVVFSPTTCFLFGGAAGLQLRKDHVRTVLRYNHDAGSTINASAWSHCASAPFTTRKCLSRSVAVTKEALYVFFSLSPSLVWRYDCKDDRWSQMNVVIN